MPTVSCLESLQGFSELAAAAIGSCGGELARIAVHVAQTGVPGLSVPFRFGLWYLASCERDQWLCGRR